MTKKLIMKQLENEDDKSDVAQALREVFGIDENNK